MMGERGTRPDPGVHSEGWGRAVGRNDRRALAVTVAKGRTWKFVGVLPAWLISDWMRSLCTVMWLG